MVIAITPASANNEAYFWSGAHAATERRQRPQSPNWMVVPSIQAVLFGDIGEGLNLVQPLQLNIEQDEDQSYIVSDDIFLVYGDSENQKDAVGDYVTSLIEFYNMIKESEDPFDQRQFAQLQAYIQPKSQRGYDAVQTSSN